MQKTFYFYTGMKEIIYLDYNATTPVDHVVLEKMIPWFTTSFGNASSSNHAYGWQAAAAVDLAREQVAALINATKEAIIFTSGATESINLAIQGLYAYYKGEKKHIITCVTEHKAVLDTCTFLEKKGVEISLLPVNNDGEIDLMQLKQLIRKDTLMVALMYVNNETGVKHPVEAIGEICRFHNITFFCDATQAVGKIPVNVETSKIDMLCFSAHKLYGPKGAGILYLKRKNPRVNVSALLHGGGHERGFRSGTLNVPAIVGIGAASALALNYIGDESKRIYQLRNHLEDNILKNLHAYINGYTSNRISHVSNICFTQIVPGRILSSISNRIAVASGSACTSALPQPSHVLKAMGLNDIDAKNSIRFSLGRYTTETDIETTISVISKAIAKLENII